MRRLLRWAFNLAAVVSAALSVGACVMWVLTQRYGYSECYTTGGAPTTRLTVGVAARSGRVRLWRLLHSAAWPGFCGFAIDERRIHIADAVDAFAQDESGLDFRALGFRYHSGPYLGLDGSTDFLAPDWSLALLFAATPALRLRGWWRGRRRDGLCRRCGYDLRATPGRCPECGTLPNQARRPDI